MTTSNLERLRQLERAVEADRQLQDMENRLALVVQRIANCQPTPSPPSNPLPFGLGYTDIALGLNIGLLGWLVMVRFLGYTLPLSPDRSEMRDVRSAPGFASSMRLQPSASAVVPTPNSALRTPNSEPRTPYPLEKLFATKRSPGSIAVGAAEGNLTTDGDVTSTYYGHTDPGNEAHNEGFCSWNHADGISVEEADQQCLRALQLQSAQVIQNLHRLGIQPTMAVVVNGTDLWNQSNQAGAAFARAFKEAFEETRVANEETIVAARVEAFRNTAKQLDASGLFGICSRYGYYQKQLQAYASYPASWQWECIALDQRRRVQAIAKALKLQIR